jgi:hypothetical protein
VAQRNFDEVLSYVSQNEVKSQLSNLNSQLNSLNNQLATEKTRNLELDDIISQLRADIALSAQESSLRDKTHSDSLENFQQQLKELQLQLEQQIAMTESQREEIKVLKETKALEVTPAAVAPPVEPLSGPPVHILQKQLSKEMSPTEDTSPAEVIVTPTSSSTPPPPGAGAGAAVVSVESSSEYLELQKKLEELQLQLPPALENEGKFNELKATTKNEIKKWMKEFEKANGEFITLSS